MTDTATTSTLPLLLEEVEVRRVERLSPSFVRVELGAPGLAELGAEAGEHLDQRIKLVFPSDGGRLPSFAGAGEGWYAAWAGLPEAERGHMRTYTIRDVRGSGEETRLVVDIVVHEGPQGPGGSWALRAAVGDRVAVMAPRKGHKYGGIEFAPGTASRLLLVGDETAVPAISAVLEQLPVTAVGAAFLEVPAAGDVLTVQRPDGVRLTWLPRDHGPRHEALHAAVLEHLGVDARTTDEPDEPDKPVEPDDIDPDLWETPTYSSSGDPVDEHLHEVGGDLDDLYAWIAGESSMVTGLRRALVRDLGIDRHQVAFMGYWREGVAMQS